MLDIKNNLFQYRDENKNIKIAVAMSGGVDSSTVAYLLKKQGYNIIGITMRTCKDEDADAKKIADDLGIEHYVYDATKSFKEKVIDYFVKEYIDGKTPNPCMICNRNIKFGDLIDFARSKGADFMATGHYARLVDGKISMGDDDKKDQVYFLSQIKKEYLKYIVFPIGELEKTQVRELAKDLGVRVYAKKDSQEICFVDDGMLKEFLIEQSCGEALNPGNIVDQEGKILGKHNGLSFYTIGQRKGLGISSDTPYYVVKLDKKRNEIVVGSNEDLLRDKIEIKNMNLLAVDSLKELENLELYAKTRSRDTLHKCKVEILNEKNALVTILDGKVRAVTPGQGLVLYDKEKFVVASGFIK